MEKNKEKKVILSELDVEILCALYKCDFMTERQLAVMVGENSDYIKGRTKKLANAGIISRTVIRDVAVNYISKKGVKEAALPPRNIHEPKLSRYEHSLGFVDSCVWFSMYRHFKDGSYHSWVPFGSIITERDFAAVREMQVVKYRADGQPVYVAADKDVHAPDGYFRRADGSFAAIEFERTQKSSIKIMRANILENFKRFKVQYWIFDDPYVGKTLYKIRAEVGDDRMFIYDIRIIRSEIDRYVDTIPKTISSKSGIPRHSCLGQMVEPVPLNRLPLSPDYKNKIVLEKRTDTSNTVATPVGSASPAPVQAVTTHSVPVMSSIHSVSGAKPLTPGQNSTTTTSISVGKPNGTTKSLTFERR